MKMNESLKEYSLWEREKASSLAFHEKLGPQPLGPDGSPAAEVMEYCEESMQQKSQFLVTDLERLRKSD